MLSEVWCENSVGLNQGVRETFLVRITAVFHPTAVGVLDERLDERLETLGIWCDVDCLLALMMLVA